MGTALTIDKHTSSLEDWLAIQNKLDAIEFTANAHTHLSVWKLCLDEIDQTIVLLPFALSLNQSSQLVSPNQAYVVCLVKRDDHQGSSKAQESISQLLKAVMETVQPQSYKTCIKQGRVSIQQGSGEQVSFFIYAYLGKNSSNILKLSALSYAYKLGTFLNSSKRIRVISGGGVYRNKKLQMGSVVPLNKQNCHVDISRFRSIHLVEQLIGSSESMNENDSCWAILKIKPTIPLPIIRRQEPDKSSRNHNSNSSNTKSKKKKQVEPDEEESSELNFEVNAHFMSSSFDEPNEERDYNQYGTNGKVTAVPKLKEIPSKSIGNSVKPPMLKLALKPYEQQEMTYQEMKQQQKNNKFDMRDTARHQLKMQKFSNDCSLIIEGLYLSGEKVAKNESALIEKNITQIVNCAGDYCENWFQNVKGKNSQKKYRYLTFFLKDSQHENIECLFYRVIDFINSSHRAKKNVLIHCIQGISRSVTFVLAYLIFMNGFDYKKAEAFVKEKRAIACPNNGFMVELIQFHKRLYEGFSSLPIPRVFLVSPHRQETPDIMTARMIKQKLFDQKKYVGLDSRGMYIVQCEQTVYLWVGSKCEGEEKMKKYWAYSQEYIRKLQEHQKAPMKVKAISEGKEGRDFLGLWGLDEMPANYQSDDYNKIFDQLSPLPTPGYLRKYYEREEEQNEESYQSRLYIYPDSKNGLGVFDLEDLSGFSIVVKSDPDNVKIFVWKESSWQDNVEMQGEFLDQVITNNYQSYDQDHIDITEESFQLNQLSEEFLACFS